MLIKGDKSVKQFQYGKQSANNKKPVKCKSNYKQTDSGASVLVFIFYPLGTDLYQKICPLI